MTNVEFDDALQASRAVPAATADIVARERARFQAALHEVGRAPKVRTATPHGWWSRGRLVLSAAAVAVAVLLAGPVLNPGQSGASAAAAEVLNAAGDATAETQDNAADRRYWHVVANYRQDGGPVRRRETWLTHGGSVFQDTGLGPGTYSMKTFFGAGIRSLDWQGVRGLPTTPDALRTALLADTGVTDARSLLGIIGELLRASPAGPAQRRALWQLMATIPGADVVGPARDSEGRIGQAVEFRHGRDFRRFVVEVKTGTLLEESSGSSDVEHAGFAYEITLLEQGGSDTPPPPADRS